MTDTYRDYLKKYCGCKGPICTPNDAEESQKGVKPLLLVVQERAEKAKRDEKG